MKYKDEEFPMRVFINAPSTQQPYNKYHGKIGIAVLKYHNTGFREISVWFTEDSLITISMSNDMYIIKKN